MDNQAFIEDLMRTIANPGVEQLMNSRFFTELRAGELSKRRLQDLPCSTIFRTM